MENQFLVGSNDSQFSEGNFFIISAATEDEAMEIYIKNFGIKEDYFIEHVYDKTINASFAEHFFDPPYTEDKDEFESRFIKGVRDYFGDHTDYAELYIKEYFADDDDFGMTEGSFPDEMLTFMFKNSNWSPISVFKLDDIRKL